MRYLSVCSGIEAATCAWHHMGWQAVAFSEIEKFPSAVLAHHYSNIPNLGDMTQYKEWNIGSIDILVGGTPCQSFSVAGLRKGLEDPRGNLALVYCGILNRFKPQWFVWENVPGVLSSNKGRDFGSFLGAVAELGYGFAYRVLDAQYFGVAQRRRRVFVVGHLGDWRPPATVLFESDCLCGNPPPSRPERQNPASFFESSLAQYRQADIGGTLKASGGVLSGGSETFVRDESPHLYMYERLFGGRIKENPKVVPTMEAKSGTGGNNMPIIGVYESHAQDARYNELNEVCSTVSSYYGMGGGNVPIAVENSDLYALAENTIGRQPQNGGNGNGFTENGPMYTLNATGVHGVAHAFKVRGGCEGDGKGYLGHDEKTLTSTHPDQHIAVSFNTNVRPYEMIFLDEQSNTSTASQHSGTWQNMAVRRLTPVECERLQGFPDNYTNIPWNKKTEAPDGPRYKALGNSMAVPVMRWIGEKIRAYTTLYP